MVRQTGSVLALLLISITALATDDPTKRVDDVRRIQGTWKMEQFWENGDRLDPTSWKGRTTWTITPDRMTLRDPVKDQIEEIVEYELRSKQQPAMINLKTDLESEGDLLIKGIYELKGDTLKICFVKNGGDRPPMFSSPKGSQSTLVILKREK